MTSAGPHSIGFAARNALYDGTLEKLVVPFESQFVTTRFGKTHLITAGLDNPESIFVLHGAASSAAACWPLINGLAKTHRVYAIDIPRHLGKTEPFRLSPRRDDYALWLIDILDHFAIDRAHFIGFSFGGWVTLKLAAVADERISKAVLISPVGVVNFRLTYLLRAPILLLKALLYPSGRSLNGLARLVAGPSAPQSFVDEIADAGRVFIQNFHMPATPVRPSRQDLQKHQSQTLVLLGQHDSFCEPNAVLSRLNANLPDGRVEIIPDAGHALIYEHAALVNARILKFLNPGM
ncbi:MAG: alpha/beta fold hydrolase [Anaerolineales bacterium]|nr:alpha/beta fold hydrolase [Anaerolineales bacterium]